MPIQVKAKMFAVASLGVICGSACIGSEPVACAKSAALYYAESDPAQVGVDPDAIQAIGAIAAASAPTDVLCTAVLIDDSIVLTARHCASEGRKVFQLGEDASHPAATFSVRQMLVHETLDLALLELAESARAYAMPISGRSVDETLIGARLVISGFGETETGTSGRRLFLRQEVVEVAPESVSVWGGGKAGACAGDSGGPLLSDSQEGGAAVLGILSRCSASCVGIDLYVRLDVALDWLSAGGARITDEPKACTLRSRRIEVGPRPSHAATAAMSAELQTSATGCSGPPNRRRCQATNGDSRWCSTYVASWTGRSLRGL